MEINTLDNNNQFVGILSWQNLKLGYNLKNIALDN